MLIGLFGVIGAGHGESLAKDQAPLSRPLFESEAALAVTLEAPWPDVVNKAASEVRHPAVLSYVDAAGRAHRLDATVQTRGISRRKLCGVPPLRLRFEPDAAVGTEFAGQRSLKLVTHCNAGPRWTQYYVQEWLAYRIYRGLTEHSFKVRALDITYRGLSGGRRDSPQFGFLIEDVDHMARRNGRKESKQARFAPREFDAVAMTRFMLFQYLIGNTDWEVMSGPKPDRCCHNVRVTQAKGVDGMIAVPYDLDSAGLVDATYAGPHESLPIRDVKQRLFRGFCRHNEALEPVRREFLDRRESIEALIDREPRLNTQRRRAVQGYVDEFYRTLSSDARFAREITAKCRK